MTAMKRRPQTDAIPEVSMDTVRRSHRWLSPIARYYFRSDVRGLERVPKEQTILVGNHDGGVLAVDAICFGVGWYDYFNFRRPLYVLTHDILHDSPERTARLFAESGLVRADRAHMDAALATGESVLVFPGAAREAFRSYRRRREIDLGGRLGFISQAIRWRLPITPVVSAGAHETVIVLSSGQRLARRLHINRLVRSADVLPILLGLPWGIWALPLLPQFPLPAKITVEVLEPVWLPRLLGRSLTAADADDRNVLRAGYQLLLARMLEGIHRLYDERRWPIIG